MWIDFGYGVWQMELKFDTRGIRERGSTGKLRNEVRTKDCVASVELGLSLTRLFGDLA